MKRKFYGTLKKYHIPKKYIKEHILPENWNDEKFKTEEGYREAIEHLRKIFKKFPFHEFEDS